MKLGVVYPQTEFGSDVGLIREYAVAAEELGYDQLAVYEHILGGDHSVHELSGPYTHETEFHEPFVLFGYLSALTSKIELVTAIRCSHSARPPSWPSRLRPWICSAEGASSWVSA